MQADGRPPAVFAGGSAPGESGVSVRLVRFRGSAHLRTTVQQHLVFFQIDAGGQEHPAPMECRMDSRRLRHAPPAGSLAICPAGVEAAADAHGSLDGIIVAIDPRRFALAAAEESAPGAALIERLSGSDAMLFQLASRLAVESRAGYPSGPLYWNDLAGGFVDGLTARHASIPVVQSRARLNRDRLSKIKAYILDHLHEPIEVATLASIAGTSPFHFSRLFSRTVGMTPHRYLVHLRLRRALAMLREGSAGLAEIAAGTGFADQSHLSRWMRRVYGISLSQVPTSRPAAGRSAEQQESSRPVAALFSD